jgi:hypothetical protein
LVHVIESNEGGTLHNLFLKKQSEKSCKSPPLNKIRR